VGFSIEPIEHIDWFERYENSPCLNHRPINSDGLEGVIRNPIQQEEVVGRALRGSVCSLPMRPRWSPSPPQDTFQTPCRRTTTSEWVFSPAVNEIRRIGGEQEAKWESR